MVIKEGSFWYGFLTSKSKMFVAFCFCFLSGVALWSLVYMRLESDFWLWCFWGFVFFFPFCYKKSIVRFIFLCIFFFLLGLWRVNSLLPTKNSASLLFYHGQRQTLVATVVVEPDVRIDGVRYVLQVRNLLPQAHSLEGRVYLKSNPYPRYSYGDILEVDCLLQTPEPVENFRYDRYLATLGVSSLCISPTVEKIDEDPGSVWFRHLLEFKQNLMRRVNSLWPEPHSSFVSGLLFGYRGGLGELQEDFNRTGITHVVAISGYNITLVVSVLSSVFLWCLVSRKKAFWIIIIGIIVFIIFVGASASVVRAGIMGSVVLTATQLGRPSRALQTMILAVTLMTLQNPFVLLWDAGFQLSVLSTLGLFLLTPSFKEFFSLMPNFLSIREVLSSTLAALLFTLPLVLYQFGRFSVVAPLVNLLVLPFLPFAMLASFLALLMSFFSSLLALFFSFVTYFVLQYVIEIVKWFSGLSFAAVEIKISSLVMVLLYVIIFFLCQYHKRIRSTSP